MLFFLIYQRRARRPAGRKEKPLHLQGFSKRGGRDSNPQPLDRQSDSRTPQQLNNAVLLSVTSIGVSKLSAVDRSCNSVGVQSSVQLAIRIAVCRPTLHHARQPSRQVKQHRRAVQTVHAVRNGIRLAAAQHLQVRRTAARMRPQRQRLGQV